MPYIMYMYVSHSPLSKKRQRGREKRGTQAKWVQIEEKYQSLFCFLFAMFLLLSKNGKAKEDPELLEKESHGMHPARTTEGKIKMRKHR